MFSDSEEEGPWLGSEDSSYAELLKANYRVLRDIGEGGFAEVKLAKHLLTQSLVAIKIIPKTRNNEILTTEMDLMSSLDHPNVIKLYEIIETDDLVYLVLEYAKGERRSAGTKSSPWRTRTARSRWKAERLLRCLQGMGPVGSFLLCAYMDQLNSVNHEGSRATDHRQRKSSSTLAYRPSMVCRGFSSLPGDDLYCDWLLKDINRVGFAGKREEGRKDREGRGDRREAEKKGEGNK
ncbi:uncharacterized protein RHO17_012003 [Thomomys bottae]